MRPAFRRSRAARHEPENDVPLTRRAVVVGACALLALTPRPAHATWSIVILDRVHRWIGVAGASCTPDVYGIMSLHPGEGVVIAQAIGDDAAIQRANALFASGASADSIVRVVTVASVDAGSARRQYAIASFAGGLAQFTGDSTPRHHGERRSGEVLVQGNSLAGATLLDRVMTAIARARAAGRPLQEVLMAGLTAGARAGGDVRCGAQRATSAFLVVARPGERPFLPYLTLSVFGAKRGTVNAVEVLAVQLARWTASGGAHNAITQQGIQPPQHVSPAAQSGGGLDSRQAVNAHPRVERARP